MKEKRQQSPEKDLAVIQEYKISVLLIDDQAMIAEAVRRSLDTEDDIDFHYCDDPSNALRIAIELKPTLILQDLVMPGIDGLTMVKFFRANEETIKIPIIVLSTKEEPKIKSQAFESGANDYLVKLPDKIELIARIRYHSQAYIVQKQRDEAFRALEESQRRLAAANLELQKLSSLDGLTGVPNRRRFDELLRQEWHRGMRHCSSLSLIMLDIDYFKKFNDTYGHQRGDECLKMVASSLDQAISRETDLVARYGGEEFAVILPETGMKGAEAVAENMRSCVEELAITHEASEIHKYVTISLGVASTVPEREFNIENLIFAADKALYKAKEEGRNRVRTMWLHGE